MALLESRVQEIRIAPKYEDILGQSVLHEAKRSFGLEDLQDVRTATVYRVVAAPEEAAKLAEALCDPVTQKFSVNSPVIESVRKAPLKTRLVEGGSETYLDPEPGNETSGILVDIGRKIGVMETRIDSLMKFASDRGLKIEGASVSMEHAFIYRDGVEPNLRDIKRVVEGQLVNKTVDRVLEDGLFGAVQAPEILYGPYGLDRDLGPSEQYDCRDYTDEQLQELGDVFRFTGGLEKLKVIRDYCREKGRGITQLELSIIDGWWSEHCGHGTFKSDIIVTHPVSGIEARKPPLMTRIKEASERYFTHPITGREKVISAFKDNSGVMLFYDGYSLCIKVETHNSPSAIEPKGGAMTGSGGVFRDVLGTGKGARVIISTDVFCLAPPTQRDISEGTLAPDYLLRKVVEGVRDYGNPVGVPTNNGSLHFHPDYGPKPSVYVGAVGLIKTENAQRGKPDNGDLAVLVGGKTGADGIYGGVFSSLSMRHDSTIVYSQAVQIGNPIEEKKVMDLTMDLSEEGLIKMINDCGAVGLSSAGGEMGDEAGGLIAHTDQVPLKYPLQVWQIWISESQERMVVAIDPSKKDRVMELAKKHGVEATVFGEFNNSGRMVVKHNDQVYADLDYEFLENMPKPPIRVSHERPDFGSEIPEMPTDWVNTIKNVLSYWNICSKEAIVRQYDHGVQGMSALEPFTGVKLDGPNDAAIIRPFPDKPFGAIKAHGINPILNRIDPRNGALWAFTEAMANYVAVGGDWKEAAVCNNYVFPSMNEQTAGMLDLAVDGVIDGVHGYFTPVFSGKDSLSSTYIGDGRVIEVPPGVLISVLGKTENVKTTISADIKNIGSTLCLVGKQDSGMGGSTYFDVNGIVGNNIPKIDTEVTREVFESMYQAIQTGEVSACHDISEGGVLTSVFEMCVGGDCGVELSLETTMERPDMFLFNETAGCFVVEVKDEETARKLFGSVPMQVLGKTVEGKEIRAKQGKKQLFTAELEELKAAWKKPMEEIFA
jgi:phosphoribosylformylglycinamidine synthase subunit PurSL